MTTIKIIAMACDKTRTEVVQKELVASTTQDNSTSLNPQKTSWFVKRAQVKQLCLWVMWFISTLKRICCGLNAQVKQQNVVFVGDVIYIDLETHLLWLRAQVKQVCGWCDLYRPWNAFAVVWMGKERTYITSTRGGHFLNIECHAQQQQERHV